jgi:hypothetical protein
MIITLPATAENRQLIEAATIGFFSPVGTGDEFPELTIRSLGDQLIAEGNEGEYPPSMIEAIYRALSEDLPVGSWEPTYPE